MSHPKISVLLPVYNGERFLREALESILNQSFRDFELLAADDGSTDGTRDILREFAAKDKRIRLFENEKNEGLSATLSRVFAECRGEYFVRHDSDDISLPHRFARQAGFLDQNSGAGAIGSATEYIDADGNFLGKQHQAWSCEEASAHLLLINCFCNTSMMMRRHWVEEAGGLQSNFRWAEDYDFFERLSRVAKISVLPEILVHYRLWENYFTKIHRREQMADAFEISLRAVRRRLSNMNFDEAAYRRFWVAYFEQEGLIEEEKTRLESGDGRQLRLLWQLLASDPAVRKLWGHAFTLFTDHFIEEGKNIHKKPARIFYLVTDYQNPSWGTGQIYSLVRLSRAHGFEAFVLHHQAPFCIDWLEDDVPIAYLDGPDFSLTPEDILIVPEVSVENPFVLKTNCRKVAYIQNSFFIASNAGTPPDYKALGYEAVWVILPHIEKIVRKYFGGVSIYMLPPYVAPYFFLYPEDLKRPRQKEILLYPKTGNLDYGIFKKMLLQKLPVFSKEIWHITELCGMKHIEVALAMRRAKFFVNLNTHEAFNTSVPEAMAAGCIALCYEAVGGRDFLRHGKNAFVFPNNHVYDVLDCLLDLVRHEDQKGRMRRTAYQTALGYSEKKTEAALIYFYERFLKISQMPKAVLS